MADIPFPRGVRDLMPNEAIAKNEVIEKIERVYRRFGFLPIATPAMESMDVLMAKDVIGDENKLIFKLEEQNNGLRYDHTVGLARYISMHSSMPLPFKRYAIGTVWRMDEPQKMRLREFTQADIDILGGDPYKSNAEVIAAACTAMDELGLDYTLKVNSRRTVDAFLKSIGLESKLAEIMRSMDKFDKIGKSGVAEELGRLGIDDNSIDRILEYVSISGSNEERMKAISDFVGSTEPCEEFEQTFGMLENYKINGKIIIDNSIVRGIDYYTGIVFETIDNTGVGGATSICSGGRYDNLVSRFSDNKLPGVGLSIGVDRVLEVMNFGKSSIRTYSKACVCYIKEQNYAYALNIANRLRSEGIETDTNIASRNISNQLSYVSALGIRFALIVGDKEQLAEKVKLRDMDSGEELVIGIDDAVKRILSNL